MPIPITKPHFDKAETAQLEAALKSGWVMQGPRVGKFETIFAKYVGSRFAVATSSGTTALHIALEAAGIGAGDEVITTAFSFIATANSIRYCGAYPVFCDIDIETYNLDPEKVKEFIETGCKWEKGVLRNKKTKRPLKAIMPVDQVGLPADLDSLKKIARKYNLSLIEDAACALGSKYKGSRIGNVALISCFSFHPRKIITTAEGGMITTNKSEIAKRLKALRSHGQALNGSYPYKGYNYRMSDLHAALGIAQMHKLDKILAVKKKQAAKYQKSLEDINMLKVPYVPEYAMPNWQSYILKVIRNPKVLRDRIVKDLAQRGITAKAGITAIHKEPFYRKLLGKTKLPHTEEANRSTFMIPIYPSLKEKEQDYIIESLKAICKKHS